MGPNGMKSPCVVGNWDVPWALNARVATTESAWPDVIFHQHNVSESNIWKVQGSTNPDVRRKFAHSGSDTGFMAATSRPGYEHMKIVLQKACWAMYQPDPPMRHIGEGWD